jgi:hypothetical protein
MNWSEQVFYRSKYRYHHCAASGASLLAVTGYRHSIDN